MIYMYKIINRIIDIVTGFNIKSELIKILTIDGWTRQMIIDDQRVKFEKLSNIAGSSQYYRTYQGKDLNEYPIMSREEFRNNFEELKTEIRKPYSIQYTSGSTSTPVTHIISKEMLLAKRISHQKLLHWHGLTRESPEFKIGGIESNFVSRLYYVLKNKRYVHSFEIKDRKKRKIIKKYNRFKPSILYGYPSTIYDLIMYAENQGIKMHNPNIIVTHAEILAKEFKEKFQSIFPNSRVLNQYWATEANIAETCPEGNLHIDEDTVICELINKNGDGVGDLLITNLYSYDLPIIRYKIGDRVKFSEDECPCGRKTRVIEYFEGREIDYLNLPDGRSIPVTAFYFSRYAKNMLAYQMVYYKKQSLIEFRYMTNKEDDLIESAKIAAHLMKDYGLSTRFVRVSEIQYTRSGKFKKLLFGD